MGKTVSTGRRALGARIKTAVEEAGGTTKVLKILGGSVSPSTLARYITGESEASAEKLGSIATATGKTLDWLIFGKERTISGEFQIAPTTYDDDTCFVPILDISAGAGGGVVNGSPAIIGRHPFSRSKLRSLGVIPEKVDLIRARGDSMEPTIKDQADVLIDKSRCDIREGGVFAVSIGSDLRLKRVRRNFDGTIILISDNRELYHDEVLSPADAQQLVVHGRVFWTEKSL